MDGLTYALSAECGSTIYLLGIRFQTEPTVCLRCFICLPALRLSNTEIYI